MLTLLRIPAEFWKQLVWFPAGGTREARYALCQFLCIPSLILPENPFSRASSVREKCKKREKTVCFSREKFFECLKRYTFMDFDGKTRLKWKLPLRSRAVKYAFNAFSRYSQFITWNMYSIHFSRYIWFITWKMYSIHFSRYIRFITWKMYWIAKPFVLPLQIFGNVYFPL